MDDFQLSDLMGDQLRGVWHRYLDRVEPFRPLLHGYCHKLTRNLWDAEDLAQETLIRGFHAVASNPQPIENPRAYLLRIATHAWIDQLRRRETEKRLAPAAEEASSHGADTAGVVRDAGRRLLQRLAPRERAAVLLKELFEMSLEEIAVVLETTTGAVKAALHRGRERLREPDDGPAARRPVPSVALVDRFVELFNAHDCEGMTALILDNAAVANVGNANPYGGESPRTKHGWIQGALVGHPEWPDIFRFESERAIQVDFEGEPIALLFRTRVGELVRITGVDGEALEGVYRLEEEDGQVSRLLSYAFCPETVRAVGKALGHRVRTGLYRAPTPEPGRPDAAE